MWGQISKHIFQHTFEHTAEIWGGVTVFSANVDPADSLSGTAEYMDEATTHSFVIKMWLEEINEGTRQAVWRGRIIHVSSSERKFIKDLQEIPAFIRPFLRDKGENFDPDVMR